ncbi:hypothetical protein LCGC14_2412140, partial [marine sediment metagenome]
IMYSSAPRATLGGHDYLFAKYNRDGNLQWLSRLGGPGDDNAYGVSIRGERILYAGNVDNGGNVSSGFAVFDLDGNLIINDSITGDGIESGLNVSFDISGDSTLVIGTFDGDSLKAGPHKLDNATKGVKDGFLVKYGFQFSVFEVDKTNILCNGDNTGAIEVGNQFGTEPITYEWTPNVSSSNTASALAAGPYKIVATDFEGRKDSVTIPLSEPTKYGTIEDSITWTSCNLSATSGNTSDGAVYISDTGGVEPYIYSWDDLGGQTTQDLIDVLAEDHIVTVTDANLCVEVDTFTVLEPTMVGHGGTTMDLVTTSGNDGAIYLNTYGGTTAVSDPEYGFAWTGPTGSGFISTEDTIEMLDFTGEYDLTVTDDNSCTFDSKFLLGSLNTVVATISPQDVTPVTCFGGSDGCLEVSHVGGVGPYTYEWRTTPGVPIGGNTIKICGLPAGTYFVRVTDDNDVWDEASATIEQPSQTIIAWEDSTKATSCFGSTDGAAYISVNGGWGKYSYLWIPGGKTTQDITGVAARTYNVTITD